MKPKAIIKLSVDILMTLALLFLMGYHLWGEILHEWVGAGMLLLFIAHHILNGRWYKTVFKGTYSTMRILTLCIDILVLVAMLAQMYSGIAMSRYVFDFLPSIGGMSLARRLHVLGVYWGYILMSLHLGLHWYMILGMSRKAMGIKDKSKIRTIIAFIAGLMIAGYGVWSFIRRDFLTYLFLKSEFVFLNYEESKILFYIDYFALMGLCIFIAHYSTKLIGKLRKKSEVQ
ncbi:DUF4405 domain-containing protein [Sellimonas intestinalis]|uniref:DUF4405 domain-containing protein n=1 Tax=Sellimonas intestinalis TaxID=1653434 RepID=UPI0015EC3E5E|nr:DUF4405 domain-containing protein [Sellimonas intestinalis]MBA2212588.1 DUF4405 domain-containing protein [Sellimonas intestinalis]